MEVVRDNILSATFDWLFQKLEVYVSDQLWNSNDEVCAQMESWKTLLPKITTVLQHVEENPIANEFMKSYLDDLRDLAYDMEDILEEFVVDARRSELIGEPKARPSKRQRMISNIKNFFSSSKAKPNQEIISMVNDLSGRLQKIDNEVHNLDLINLALKFEDKSHKVVAKRLPESSILEDKVLGRDSDKDAILQRLLEDGGSLEQDFVIPIVGMGGLGKTTLARLIYNDKKLEGKFDLKAWVCVTDMFDVPKITRTILEHVPRKRVEHVLRERCDSDFGLLQEELKGKLSGRKFFLVLDDVWTKEYCQWDVLKRPFMSGAPGSKIIVTTRNKDVGTMVRGDDGVYNLELLQDDACFPLFTWHALGKENFDAHLDLQDVGEKLVKRCKRLPLALKTLGGVLRGKLHRSEWEDILNSEIWSLSEDRSGILPTLRLSYNHLPPHLKQCFAYCALFPKDYEFDEKELVLLWMAEGLLQQQSHGKKQMEEEIGHQYFQELLSRSLFQQSSGVESRFVMHDLINDLAVDVAGEIYCNLERDEKLEKARHLSYTPHLYEISKRFIVLDKLKPLRTFLPLPLRVLKYSLHFDKVLPGFMPVRGFSYNPNSYLSNRILHDFLPTLNRLRVLSLRSYQISKLPDFFENLKLIRYIDLSGTRIECIHESVGSLLFLQTLLLSGCEKLTKLPTTIGNLIDLHHLDITSTPSLEEMPSRIGNLKNLVTLPKILVGKASGLMRLSDLKNLSQLRGRLSILNLQNVLDVQDAWEANLDKIHGLEQLALGWTALDDDRDESILTWLKPHSNLKSLKIFDYGGKSFPNWVCDPLFLNLSSMELSYCKRCPLLPSLGRLPVLKELIIKGMEAIEVVGPEFCGGQDCFPSLEILEFENMLNWKEWTSPTGSEGEFCRLYRLAIKNCPKLLGQLPSNLSSLEELIVERCNAMLLKSMVDLTSLTNLRIGQISELTCLPKSFTQSLTALETLYIENCNDLTCLWEEGTEIEQSLLPFNLKHLSLLSCKALQSLPDAMMMRMDGSSSSNSSMLMLRLEKFEIWGCDSLKFFPRGKLPISLKYLRIVHCKGLESLPDVDGDNNNSNLHLEIRNVPCLYSSEGCHQLPAFLKKLRVEDGGERSESFPEKMLQHCTGLQTIDISNCKILKSLPTFNCVSNLVDLSIYCCEALESLPSTMYQLKSLQRLAMIACPSIELIPEGGLPPNLTHLQLRLCRNLKGVPNTMYQLTSLQSLTIPGGSLMMGFGRELQNLTSLQNLRIEQKLPADIVLPSSLTSLGIYGQKNLESIPSGFFRNLNSLKYLEILHCRKLRSLPREGFPPWLGRLHISDCPLLKRQHFEEKGEYYSLTCTIPCIRIDQNQVDY
ncbi:hypothetical protein SLEP1_g49300 [Rubroshorea leprosula]|uniref:Disease resistance RPP13-like protein 1 n=1 Tax=Rubroshorea leprosula TaxID=152421 RepID=A0AAV5LYL4_9ROSI|nr:hypothetical protein SLEP1_g49300 [Rubroshorea leprosula]